MGFPYFPGGGRGGLEIEYAGGLDSFALLVRGIMLRGRQSIVLTSPSVYCVLCIRLSEFP